MSCLHDRLGSASMSLGLWCGSEEEVSCTGAKEISLAAKLRECKIPFTLLMAETQNHGLVFGFSFPSATGFQGKVVLVSGEKWS